MINLTHEAELLTKYLTGRPATAQVVDLYAKAMHNLSLPLNATESKYWDFMMRNEWSIGCIDGAMALRNPKGNIRQKIFILFAILESTTDYSDLFLPVQQDSISIFNIFISGARGVIRTIIGLILLPFIS